MREGTLVYTRLIAANALRGYENFFVIGAYTSAPTIIHSRKPVASLAALKGQKIRTNNAMEAEALDRFGAIPTIMPASRLADALTRGAVDAVMMSPGGLFQFGTARLAANHYLLGVGSAPLLVLMNRKKFDSLPEAAQALIRKYSGERAAATWIEMFGPAERRSLDKIKSDPARKAVEPSPADRAAAQKVYKSLDRCLGRQELAQPGTPEEDQSRSYGNSLRPHGRPPWEASKIHRSGRYLGLMVVVLGLLVAGTWFTVRLRQTTCFIATPPKPRATGRNIWPPTFRDLEQIAAGETPSSTSMEFLNATRHRRGVPLHHLQPLRLFDSGRRPREGRTRRLVRIQRHRGPHD